VCPGQHESAGKSKSGKTRKGSKWLHTHLNQAAKAAARTKGTYLQAQYYRLKGRRGHAEATVAVEHSILVAAYHILDRGSLTPTSARTGSPAATTPPAAPEPSPTRSARSATTSTSNKPHEHREHQHPLTGFHLRPARHKPREGSRRALDQPRR
jgi:hypothetical protein